MIRSLLSVMAESFLSYFSCLVLIRVVSNSCHPVSWEIPEANNSNFSVLPNIFEVTEDSNYVEGPGVGW